MTSNTFSDESSREEVRGVKAFGGMPGAPGTVVVAEDPAAPSKEVSSKRQSLSDVFTIVSLLFVRKSRFQCIAIRRNETTKGTKRNQSNGFSSAPDSL